ncbi:O-acyltransferase like protein-like [Toxorhynchites rutilus septentrionalis]|uniref:O-acyltransferase like protein-like n=1 Tax=Toxorhynchites rutilus septentrionalis TaxID=329112 RepID=UPI002479D8E8|nr:O-acyltransferase like protein-like [Toxorhynchites rutilus septentrionalis]XP_055620843.1 O-acyltransferase like protein-like [Toxorhynchites rutilus septentrionalis]
MKTGINIFLWWMISFCYCCSLAAVGCGNSNLYGTLNLPKLYEYDDFDACRRGNPHFQYCVVQATIQPDQYSNLWRNISHLSENTRNFPRHQLERGLCLRDCLRTLFRSSEADIDRLEIAGTTETTRVDYLNQCVNLVLHDDHGLYASSKIIHCMSEADFTRKLDQAEKLFIGVLLVLGLLVSVATQRHFEGKEGKYDAFIKPFALQKNLNELFNMTDRGNLLHLEGLRAISMLIIIVVHSSLPMIRMPLKNPEDMEQQTNSFMFPFINSGNTHMIQMFFTLGGMTLAVSTLNHIDKSTHVDFRYLWKKFLNRLARLMPAYAFVIFYQATLFKRTKLTPVAYKFVDYCDAHWWTNLLFINNVVHLDKPCLQYGWYLGADFQLFLIGMAIMVLIWKFPHLKKAIAGAMILVGLAVPFFVIYKENLDSTMSFNMRHALTELRVYDVFLKYYTPAETNAINYFIGMIAGMMYHHVSRNNLQSVAQHFLSKSTEIILTTLLLLNVMLTILPPLPSLFRALFGTALKAMFGIGNAYLYLYFGFKSKSIARAFLSHPVLRVIARLSYSVYIIQYSVIYPMYTNLSVPITYSAFSSLLLTSSILFLSFIGGLLLHLVVETPFANILKQAIDGKLRFQTQNVKQLHEKSS